MPTYEFRCPDGHTFERFYRSISGGEAEVPCPQCGKTATRQMSAGAGLLFKGSGFYLTDYGKNAHRGGDSPAEKAKKTAEAASGSESKSTETKSSDAKPAAEAKPDASSKSTKADGGSAPAAPSTPSPKPDK
jgi:putative FmdB family regulatory protein